MDKFLVGQGLSLFARASQFLARRTICVDVHVDPSNPEVSSLLSRAFSFPGHYSDFAIHTPAAGTRFRSFVSRSRYGSRVSPRDARIRVECCKKKKKRRAGGIRDGTIAEIDDEDYVEDAVT